MKMTYEARDGYLYVRATGEFESSAARDPVLEWIQQARNHNFTRIFVDVTHLAGFDDYQATTMTRYNISMFVIELLPRNFRLAVLETPQQIPGGRFSENVMSNRGIAVRITANPNEALEWLMSPSSTRQSREAANAKSSPQSPQSDGARS